MKETVVKNEKVEVAMILKTEAKESIKLLGDMKIIRDSLTKVNASLQITSKAAAGKEEDA